MTSHHPYLPDDAHFTVAALEYLRTPDGLRLRQAIAQLPDAGAHPTVARVAALRKSFPAAPIHAALVLAQLQPKATGPRGKFPDMPFLWSTPEALEQATDAAVAAYKARRLSLLRPPHIFDLCAGIGGDTLALAGHASVTAVELSAVRTTCLRFNTLEHPPRFPIDIRTQDLRELLATLPTDGWIHIDPARRAAGKRSPRYEDLIPGPDILRQIFARVRGGAIKLSPAADFDSLPPGHLELISHQGSVVQALLWIGTDASPQQRTATILAAGQPDWSLTALPGKVVIHANAPEALVRPADAPVYVYELDGAVTRAGLAPAFAAPRALWPLTIDGGYLLSEPGAALLTEPPLTAFRVQAIVPFARVPEFLEKSPFTRRAPVEVKSRGHLPGIDPDDLQTAWSKIHSFAATVLLFRHAKETRAIIAQRVAH